MCVPTDMFLFVCVCGEGTKRKKTRGRSQMRLRGNVHSAFACALFECVYLRVYARERGRQERRKKH